MAGLQFGIYLIDVGMSPFAFRELLTGYIAQLGSALTNPKADLHFVQRRRPVTSGGLRACRVGFVLCFCSPLQLHYSSIATHVVVKVQFPVRHLDKVIVRDITHVVWSHARLAGALGVVADLRTCSPLLGWA